MLESQSRALKT